jgi:hypothetical protein
MTPPREPEEGGSSTVTRTLAGLAVGGVVFLALGLYLNAATGFGIAENLGPLMMLTVVGATVGGLIAPLGGRLLDRWRARKRDRGGS